MNMNIDICDEYEVALGAGTLRASVEMLCILLYMMNMNIDICDEY